MKFSVLHLNAMTSNDAASANLRRRRRRRINGAITHIRTGRGRRRRRRRRVALEVIVVALLVLALPLFVLAEVVHTDNDTGDIFVDSLKITDHVPKRGLGVALDEESVYWTTGQSVEVMKQDDGPEPPIALVAGVVTIKLSLLESSFTSGSDGSDWSITIKGIPCEPLLRLPGGVECVSGHFEVAGSSLASLQHGDISLTTPVGVAQGIYEGAFANVRLVADPKPLIGSVTFEERLEQPVSIAVDAASKPTIYWSNVAGTGSIESCLRVRNDLCSNMKIIAEDVGFVGGLALHGTYLYYSSTKNSSNGGVFRIDLSSVSDSPEVVFEGYERPMGLAYDSSREFLFFTQQSGAIHRSEMDAEDGSKSGPRRILVLPTNARLGGIAVLPRTLSAEDPAALSLAWVVDGAADSSGIYVSSAGGPRSVRLETEVPVLWPRDVSLLDDGTMFVVTYLGEIFRVNWDWLSAEGVVSCTSIFNPNHLSKQYIESNVRKARRHGRQSSLFLDSLL
jgi:hypothetical protein